MKLERDFKSSLIKELEDRFPGCLILRNDPAYRQGVPDLVMLYKDRWAAFETKRSSDAPVRPNQKYYVDIMDAMSFAAFISPDNEQEVLDDLQRAFSSNWAARHSER